MGMKKKKGVFYRFAVWAADRLPDAAAGSKGFIYGLFAARQQKELAICERLYGKGQKMIRYRELRIKRMVRILQVAVCGVVLAVTSSVFYVCTKEEVTGLARPDHTAESTRYFLTARLGEEPLGEIPLDIPARRMPENICQELLDEAQNQLETAILGENVSTEQITRDLVLPDTLCQGLVEIRWESSDFEMVDTGGRVRNHTLQDAQVVTLTAHMQCQQMQQSFSFPVIVIPPERSTAQRLELEVTQLIQEEAQEEKMQEWFSLPDTFEGLPLSWSFQQTHFGGYILLLTVLGCVGIYAASMQDLQKEEHKRQQELLQEYPGFISRLTMLAGTGMPIRAVFLKLDEKSSSDSPVYREVRRMCREMESGVTQKEAIENFGKRCRLSPYKKCASLLNQNLQRGSDGFLDALWQEAENACDDRRAIARQKSGEAQTRLLFPMMLMLLVVMVLVMVPACFSFAGM